MAFNKHKDKLAFSVLEECGRSDLTAREQFWVEFLSAELNISQVVNNLWASDEYRMRMKEIHSSDEWKAARMEIASRPNIRARQIECSDGNIFPNMASAARAFGIRISRVAHLAKTQHLGNIGVRFRFVGDEWLPIETSSEKALKSRVANGTLVFSDVHRARMSAAKIGKAVSLHVSMKGWEASRRHVEGVSVNGGVSVFFKSITEAALVVHPSNQKTACAQISKACSGVKKTAYGYVWKILADDTKGLADAR